MNGQLIENLGKDESAARERIERVFGERWGEEMAKEQRSVWEIMMENPFVV